MNQKSCPFCQQPARAGCAHLALAAVGRDFVRQCIEHCQGQAHWQSLCTHTRDQLRRTGEWSPDKEDFTWLETAFCDRFMRHLSWFGGLDHEWRSGTTPGAGGFCVLLWSRDPQKLWWEVRDELEKQSVRAGTIRHLDQPPLPLDEKARATQSRLRL